MHITQLQWIEKENTNRQLIHGCESRSHDSYKMYKPKTFIGYEHIQYKSAKIPFAVILLYTLLPLFRYIQFRI